MLKRLVLLSLPIGLVIILASGIQSDNGIAGKVGSSGENKCTECHSSYALNSGTGSIQLRTGMTNNQYVPGQTYTMVFKVAFPGRHLFGMGLEALTATNTNAGTFAMTTTKTTTKNATIGTTSRRSVVHTFNGGSSVDSMLFTFNWTAPASGTVTFYYCGVASNANASESGDYVYSGTMVVNPATSTGIESPKSDISLYAWPNPFNDRVAIESDPSSPENAFITLYDMNGKVVREQSMPPRFSAGNSTTLNGLENLPSATYILSLRQGDLFKTTRLVKQ
jgi:hypothetical protein